MGISRYTGGAWQEITDLKARSGSSWQTAELRRYDGTDWELLWPCHFTYTKEYALSSFVVTKGKTPPAQVSGVRLITGNRQTSSASGLYDSLLFFPVEEMAADLTGAQINKAVLTLKRAAKDINDGESTASIMIGCALSGVDPTRTDNTWDRRYTELISDYASFAFGQKKSVTISTAGVTALLDGTADCLCLPTTSRYTYGVGGFGYFEAEQTVLTVTYYI